MDIEEQIERCRRLAAQLNDPHVRESLEDLAQYYEAKLRRERGGSGAGFMLQR